MKTLDAWLNVSEHTHDDAAVLHQGCPACIQRVRDDQRAALIDAAPRRRVTWHAEYRIDAESDWHGIAFSLDVKVPAGWTGNQVDDEYIGLTGAAFTDALPDSCTLANIEWAVGTFKLRDVDPIDIGQIIPDPPADPTRGHPSLFEGAA